MEKNFSFSAFYRLLFQFTIILLLGGSASIASFVRSQKVVEENLLQEASSSLDKSAGLLRQRLDELDRMAAQIGNDGRIRYFYNKTADLPTADIWRLNDIQTFLALYPAVNGLIRDNFIFYHNNDIFISSSLAAIRDDSYYGGPFSFAEYGPGEWMGYMRSAELDRSLKKERISLLAEAEEYYVYYRHIPTSGVSDSKATLAFLLDSEEVDQFFTPFRDQPMGIYDHSTGMILYGNSESNPIQLAGDYLTDLDGASGIAPMPSSDKLIYITEGDFSFFLILEKRVIRKAQGSIRSIYLIIMAFAFIPGVVLALFLSYIRSQPIRQIINQLADSLEISPVETDMNMGFIQSNLGSLVREKKLLEQAREKQIPLLKSAFQERLIRGNL